MLNRSVIVLAATAALLNAGEPSWKTQGACVTPTGSLCRTLVYETSGWENRGWGFYAIERYRDRITEAVRSDGAAMLRTSHESFRYFLFPAESYDRTRIVILPKRQTFEIDYSLKEVRNLGGLWQFSEYWTDETDCGKRALMAGKMARKTGKELMFAGVRAVEYVYESADHRSFQRIAFAPSLGCTTVRFNRSRRNATGLPFSEYELRLVSASLNEPDLTLFAIPTDYPMMNPEKPWPYIWMDKFPGNISTTGFSEPVE
jgi:hypothetical protein